MKNVLHILKILPGTKIITRHEIKNYIHFELIKCQKCAEHYTQ